MHSIYIACVLGLALYGFQAFWLTRQYLRSPRTRRRPAKPHRWPSLAVQLPIYNERHVAERIIRACCNLDYPRDRLLIQVLDDSDDATSALINRAVLQAQEQGNRIEIIRRPTRQGYKAGALAYAFTKTDAEFIAVFDADFEPPPNFLQRTVPQLLVLPRPTSVSYRSLGASEPQRLFSHAASLALDGHFVVEQGGASRRLCLRLQRLCGHLRAPASKTRPSAAGRPIRCAKT